jgi:hypothetical protein
MFARPLQAFSYFLPTMREENPCLLRGSKTVVYMQRSEGNNHLHKYRFEGKVGIGKKHRANFISKYDLLDVKKMMSTTSAN